ncbi:MAG: ISAs1 family transposase [Planctomycetaceae bacterium]|nr:ISAs1 family transposase [Planctomycetaceae bacterium]
MVGPARNVQRHFVNVTDPRVDRGHNHDLLEMVFMALTATICGADGWVDVERFAKSKWEWFRQYIELPHGVPSHDTFGRVFARLDTGEFLTAMHQWVDQFAGSLRDRGIAIDGKTLKGSFDRAADQSPLHTITAFATDTRLVLRQLSVDEKSNEIPAVPVLLKLLELEGAIVTLDAMHTQVETARAIVKSQADYVMTVKQNQPQLHQRLSELFEQYAQQDYQVQGLRKQIGQQQRSHGRIEQRSCYVIDVPKGDKVLSRWPSLRSIGLLYRHSTSTDKQGETKESHDVAFFIISLPPRVRRLNQPLRDHWSIENSEHYVLDVVLTEDASRIRTGSAPEVAAAFRRLSLNILQQDRSLKENIRGKRLRAGWDEAALDGIDTAFQAA